MVLRSTPSSRARRRTAGDAYAGASPVPACGEAGCGGAGASVTSCSSSWIAASTSLDADAAGSSATAPAGAGSAPLPPLTSSWTIGVPSLTLSPTETSIAATLPALGRGDLHRGLVGLEHDERVLGGDLVADGDEDLDHGDVVEVPDVRNQDLFGASHRRLPHTRHGAGRSVSMP